MKIGAVLAELCEELNGTQKDHLSRTGALGLTMGLDSSARSDGERGMAVANALGQRGSESVTAGP